MYNVDEIKSKITCIEYARRNGIDVQKSGDRTYSPFHIGKNPTSFVCYDDSWYSFSDSIGGDVIDLCAFLKHSGDKGKAIADLAKQLNIHSDHDTKEWFDYMQQLGNRVFHYNTKLTADDMDYLHSRGISDATISSLRLGRDEDGRLVIPYWKNGSIVYYATRARPGCKFPESKYRKMKIDDYNENCVWGLDTLTRESDVLIIAEGAFDALAAYEQGYPVISAITGHFSSKQLPDALAACRQFPSVVLTYDDDSKTSHSGEKFTLKMAKILQTNGIEFKIAPMPTGFHDLSEYHAAGKSIDKLIATAEDGIGYLIGTIDNVDDMEKFILSIARNTKATQIVSYMQNSRLPDAVNKEIIKIAKSCPPETFIADEILKNHTLIYVIDDSFYEWDGKIWVRTTDTTIQDYAVSQYGKIFATAQRSINVMKLLKTLVHRDISFNRTATLTFQNGTLELDSETFREHRQSDYNSLIMDYDYNPSAKCPNWEKFISEVTENIPQRAEILQQIAGYVLFPNCKFQKIFVLVGDGSNGKSVYLNTLENIYSPKSCSYIDPANMSNEFWLIHLKDSMLNFATEINSDFSKAENVLKMVSDGTTMQACYKGQNHITFAPRCKMIFACNAMPKTKTIQGMERRLLFIDFSAKFVDDPDPNNPHQYRKDIDLQTRLNTELSGIFNWCFYGYRMLKIQNCFTEAPEQQIYLQQFRESSNPVETFVIDCADYFKGFQSRTAIYELYRRWCDENGHNPMASNRFHTALRVALGDLIVDEGQKTINGIRGRFYEFSDKTATTILEPFKEYVSADDLKKFKESLKDGVQVHL